MDDDMSELIQHEYDHLNGILASISIILVKGMSANEYLPASVNL